MSGRTGGLRRGRDFFMRIKEFYMRIFKRARTAALCLCLCLCLLAAALPADAAVKPDYVIRENFFAGMITDIFMNMSDYRGKTIQYEGFVLPITAENWAVRADR